MWVVLPTAVSATTRAHRMADTGEVTPCALIMRRRPVVVAVATLAVSTALVTWLNQPSAVAAPADRSDLALEDVAGTVLARGGRPGTVVATIRNRSAGPIGGVVARFELPAGVAFDAGSSSAGCVAPDTLVSCAMGTLAAGAGRRVTIGVSIPNPSASLGLRSGLFLAPLSDQFDSAAGELLSQSWNHEADGQFADPRTCWPISNPSPLMDIGGGGTAPSAACDGTNDSGALTPDAIDVLERFPEPFSAQVTRSWQWTTEVTPPETGRYRACGLGIDDGAYVAIGPVGAPLDDADVVFVVDTYGTTATSPSFELTAGVAQQVLVRIANRSDPGIDNGGVYPGGWDAIGLVPDGTACTADSARVFGTTGTWRTRTAAPITVIPNSDLRITGALWGRRATTSVTSVRVENRGPDTASPVLTFDRAAGLPSGVTGCIVSPGTQTATCSIGPIASGIGVVSTIDVIAGPKLGRWVVTTPDAIDAVLATTPNQEEP